MKDLKEEHKELCEQMNQLSKAVLGFREGNFLDIMKGVKLLSAGCDRLRLKLDKQVGVIR